MSENYESWSHRELREHLTWMDLEITRLKGLMKSGDTIEYVEPRVHTGGSATVTWKDDPRVAELEKEVARLTEELDATTTDRNEVMGEKDRIEIKLSQLNTTYKILAEQADIWMGERDRAIEENARLKRGEFTPDELAACTKARTDDEVWATLIKDKDVEYSVGEHGVERYGFESVTVFRREGREAVCHVVPDGRWWGYEIPHEVMGISMCREEAESKCVEQFKPKWRPAREDGSDNGESCRVRDLDGQSPEIRKLLAYEPKSIFGGPWITINEKNGSVTGWKFCEVLD